MKAKFQKIGALWLKESQRTGREFYAGTVTTPNGETFDVFMFPNKFATLENGQPLYTLHTPEREHVDEPIIENPDW